MTTNTPQFQSRWGYHRCSYELFVKLKRLHNAYWQALSDFHRWHRWQRRDERNRVGPEPRYNALFVEDKVWWKPFRRHGVSGFKVYPRTVVDHGIVDLYRAGHRPSRSSHSTKRPAAASKRSMPGCHSESMIAHRPRPELRSRARGVRSSIGRAGDSKSPRVAGSSPAARSRRTLPLSGGRLAGYDSGHAPHCD